jgi:hypothetical protein
MIDASHAVELEKLKSDSENHAQRRNYLMESNPVSVSHHLEMEALSKDDMSEIYLMADIFFAAQAWEYAYRLYVLILNSWDIQLVGVCHSGRALSAMKAAQTVFIQSQCSSAILLLENILEGYRRLFSSEDHREPLQYQLDDYVEVYLIYSQLADALRKNEDTRKAQGYLQSVSKNIPFRASRERQSTLLASDLRASYFLVQEQTSRLAISHVLNQFKTAISLRQSLRFSIREALLPLVHWCATVFDDQVSAQSGKITRRYDFTAEPNVPYPVMNYRDRRSTQFTLLFCLFWRAFERERVETSLASRVVEIIEIPTSVNDYAETIRRQMNISKSSIFSAIASLVIIVRSPTSEGSPGQILSSELYKQACANLQDIRWLPDSNIENMFLKTHANCSTLDVDP